MNSLRSTAIFLAFIAVTIVGIMTFVIYYTIQVNDEAGAWCTSKGYSLTHVGRSGPLCMTREGFLLKPFMDVKPQ